MKNIFKLLPFLIAFIVLIKFTFADSITYDEPLHVRSGVEWLTEGKSITDPFNPPLAKLPVFFTQDIILLRFFSVSYTLLLIYLVYLWTKKNIDDKTAIIAAFLLACEPTVLAFGHLFTTDILATVMFFIIFMFPSLWPLIFSVKMTLFPMVVIFIPKSKLKLTIFAAIFAAIIFGLNFRELINVFIHDFSYVFNPKFAQTHTFMLFEQLSNSGWWYYPLVILPIKLSPLLLLGFIFGLKGVISKKLLVPLIFVLITVMIGRYNTGIRHLLPLFPFVAIIAAIGLSKLNLKLIIFLLTFQIISIFLTPDLIAYFSPLVGSMRGGTIAVESNLDIGQSIYRAQKEVDFSTVNFFAFNIYNSPKITGDITNKRLLISRTLWYTAGYFNDQRLINRKLRLVANDTLVLVE